MRLSILLLAPACVKSLKNPWEYIETNVTGTLTLLELARTHGIPKFILASTSSLYGAHNAIPLSENSNTDLPLSPYAASKKGAEALCYSYHHLYGIDISVLRYFTVFGPAGRPDFVNLGSDKPAVLMDVWNMIQQMIGKRSQIEWKSAHPADVPATWADIKRARELLDWSPCVSLQQGVANFVEWYEQNRTLARDIETTT